MGVLSGCIALLLAREADRGFLLELWRPRPPEIPLLSPLTNDKCPASLERITSLCPWHWKEHKTDGLMKAQCPAFQSYFGSSVALPAFVVACGAFVPSPPLPGKSMLSLPAPEDLYPTLHGQLSPYQPTNLPGPSERTISQDSTLLPSS